jgi:hypothetical protein
MELRCEECGKVAEPDTKGWRAFLGVGLEDDHASDRFVCVFCPECAEREFGVGQPKKSVS